MSIGHGLRLPAPYWPGSARPHDSWGNWERAKQLLVSCTAGLGVQARAETVAQVLPPQTAAMQVSPMIAAVGVSRQICITSYWPLGCGPTDAVLDTRDAGTTHTLVIRLDRPNVAARGHAMVPYSHVVHYTPTVEGDLRIVVIGSDGELVANQASLKTRDLDGSFSQFDITGLWSDGDNRGSGLTFVHARARQHRRQPDDQVFGTWFLYDINGAPRWYTIQDVAWKYGGREAEGNIYEIEANTHCSPEFEVSPNLYSRLLQLGRARLVFLNDRNVRIFASGAGGNVLFMSNLVREPI